MHQLFNDSTAERVQFTAHQYQDNWEVTDLITPSQGNWGLDCVEREIIKLLSSVIGCDVINRYKSQQPCKWSRFLSDINTTVSCHEMLSSVNISMSSLFDLVIMKETNMNMWDASKGSDVKITNGLFCIKDGAFKSVCANPLSNIIRHAQQILQCPAMEGCRFVGLVGKFGRCKVLQKACVDAFQGLAEVLIPYHPHLASIAGAVYLGHKPVLKK